MREAVNKSNPDLLVNLASDAWFGDSSVSSFHLALAKLRAIEHRRFLVRATNTGVTAVVDPVGRTVRELPPRILASTVSTVRWLHTATLYDAIGDAPWYVVAILTGWFVLRNRPREQA